MQCLSRIALVCFIACSSLLHVSQDCYGQSNDEVKAPADTSLNDLVLQGDSSALADENETVEIEDSAGSPVVTVEDIFTGLESILQGRLKRIENKVPLTLNARIKSFIHYFTVRNRHYSLVMERRRRLYFPIFEQVFKERGVPDELKYLAIVESGLNARALSRAGAAGLWQFMPPTGRSFGLYIDEYIDERLDPYFSTVAAAKYLKQLNNTFDSWEFGISSYNCGPGNVRRAIRKSGYSNSFWTVYPQLPAETRGYLPQFVALTYTMKYLEESNIIADSLEYPIAFDTITLKQYINLEVFSKEINMTMEDFIELNPAFLKSYFPGHRPVLIRIPSDRMLFYAQNEADILDAAGKRDVEIKEVIPVLTKSYSQKATATPKAKSAKTKTIYTVKNGDVLGKIADKHNVGLSELKHWNNIKGNNIHPGQKLVIYKHGNSPIHSNSSAASKKTTSKKTPSYHYVKQGDTLWTISKKYDGLTIEKIKKLNNLKDGNIKPGQKLKIS